MYSLVDEQSHIYFFTFQKEVLAYFYILDVYCTENTCNIPDFKIHIQDLLVDLLDVGLALHMRNMSKSSHM